MFGHYSALALSLAEACSKEVGTTELVELFKCLEFFWILAKGRIWPINVNL